MSMLEKDYGSYDGRQMVTFRGSFQTNGASAPSLVRDGKTALYTVTRVSAGLYEVTITEGFPLPERLVTEHVSISRAATVAGKAMEVYIVKDSWNQSTRKFRIVTIVAGDVALSAYTDPAVGDPDTGERINFTLVGSITSAGTDNA